MTSLTRRFSTSGRIRGYLVAALLLPAALLAQAGVATAQGSPEPPAITVYHSLDPLGADPRSASVPAGCTPGASEGGGGDITVVADVNAVNNPIFYANVLGSGTSVLAGRGNPYPVTQIISDYQLGGGSVTVTNTTIDAAALAGYDVLIFNQSGFNVPLVYTPAELAAISTFVSNGGSVLLVAESAAGDPLTGDFLTFNDFLTGIGSSIQYTGERRLVTNGTTVVAAAPFTTGVTTFNADYYNILDGGTTIVLTTATSEPIVATEIGGGAPAQEPVCVLGGGSYEELKLWIDGGPTPSGAGEQRCSRDFDTGEGIVPGGNGDEICGAALTFQIEGIGRFRDAIEAPAGDAGIDTLVLGTPCVPNGEGPGCYFPEIPPLKQLTMIFRRGGSDPADGPRFLGSLIVDTTGLDPMSNYSLINVFGEAAGAKLQLRSIASGEAPEVIADTRAVPEPVELAQMLSGLLGLAGLNRLRRKH